MAAVSAWNPTANGGHVARLAAGPERAASAGDFPSQSERPDKRECVLLHQSMTRRNSTHFVHSSSSPQGTIKQSVISARA